MDGHATYDGSVSTHVPVIIVISSGKHDKETNSSKSGHSEAGKENQKHTDLAWVLLSDLGNFLPGRSVAWSFSFKVFATSFDT
jgi:hypothetical protein